MRWLALVGLGAFHGVNPAMGWLFAVAIGLQERSRRAVVRSLVPIALGHEASVAVVAGAVAVTGSFVSRRALTLLGAAALIGFGAYRLAQRRHFRWVGMRLSLRELFVWSFLMSSAHGAGLMLVPVLVGGGGEGNEAAAAHDHATEVLSGGDGLADSVASALAAAGVHGLAMVVVMGAVAVAVYEVLGLELLRKAWVNLDRIWAVALIGAGGLTLLS